MQIRADMQIADPDTVEFEVTITAPLIWWTQLAAKFGEGYPAWHIKALVHRLTEQAKRNITEKQEWVP